MLMRWFSLAEVNAYIAAQIKDIEKLTILDLQLCWQQLFRGLAANQYVRTWESVQIWITAAPFMNAVNSSFSHISK